MTLVVQPPSESMIVFVYQIRSYNKEDIASKGWTTLAKVIKVRHFHRNHVV